MLNGPIAHMNFARLLHPAGDARVAEFVDAVTGVNAVAERSPGFIWRLKAADSRDAKSGDFEQIDEDPLIAASLSVWASPWALMEFANKTLHGAYMRRRQLWFELPKGPNYVIWPVSATATPNMAQAWQKIGKLADDGATELAYDFDYLRHHGGAARPGDV